VDLYNRATTQWEPQPGDEVQLLNALGYVAHSTRVRRVISEDRRTRIFEVICDNGETLYISRTKPGVWEEVDL
jgi:hypothetical protein